MSINEAHILIKIPVIKMDLQNLLQQRSLSFRKEVLIMLVKKFFVIKTTVMSPGIVMIAFFADTSMRS